MICPYCKTESSDHITGDKKQQVVKTVVLKTGRIRHIFCKECRHIFSTIETIYEYNKNIDVNIKTLDLFDDNN